MGIQAGGLNTKDRPELLPHFFAVLTRRDPDMLLEDHVEGRFTVESGIVRDGEDVVMGKLRIQQAELDLFDAVFVDEGVEILLQQLVDGLRQVVRGNAEVLRHILQGQVAMQVGLPVS